MNFVQGKIEKILLPIGTWVSNNKYLSLLRQSFMAVMPLAIAGSVALIIESFPFIDSVIPSNVMTQISDFLGVINSASLSLVALFLSGSIVYYYTKEESNEPAFGMITGISCFLIVTPLTMVVEGLEDMLTGIIPMTWLGGQGLFVAMIVGFLSAIIFNKLLRSKTTIKLPDSVPPMVTEPFKVLVPMFLTFLVFATIRYALQVIEIFILYSSMFYKPHLWLWEQVYQLQF